MQDVFPLGKYKKRTLKQLAVEDRTSILYDNLVEMQSQKDVAAKHRVSP